MKAKILITVLYLSNFYAGVVPALRKTPKVYNALITTDENLTSSRAFPVIQPTVHESGIAHLPYGPYHPFGFYPPLVRLGQPIAPGLLPSDQFAYPFFQPEITRHHPNVAKFNTPQILRSYPAPLPAHSNPENEQQNSSDDRNHQDTQDADVPQSASNQEPNLIVPPKKVPIPLNEFGLPPSLIPLQQFGNRNLSPINLPPYMFNHYPLIYDPTSIYNERYLPPYEYIPNNAFGVRPIPSQKIDAESVKMPPVIPSESDSVTEPNAEIRENTTLQSDLQSFDSIKNGSANKNSDVPDVPPPAIPSGGNVVQT